MFVVIVVVHANSVNGIVGAVVAVFIVVDAFVCAVVVIRIVVVSGGIVVAAVGVCSGY